jgi:hypothetical protein
MKTHLLIRFTVTSCQAVGQPHKVDITKDNYVTRSRRATNYLLFSIVYRMSILAETCRRTAQSQTERVYDWIRHHHH